MATLPVLVGTSGKTIADRALPGGDSTLIAPVSNTTTIYLDDAPLSSATGIPLTPGSTQPWPGDRPCFAWAAVDGQQLLVGAGVDQGTNAGAIAAAIIDQGLAAQIAAQIAVAGAPSIDAPVTLHQGDVTPPAGFYYQIGGFDVSRYQSLNLRVIGQDAAAGTAGPSRCGTVLVQHYSQGVLTGVDQFTYAGDNATNTIDEAAELTCPVRAERVVVFVSYGTAGVPVYVSLTASYRQVSAARFFGGHGYGGLGYGTLLGGERDGYVTWNVGSLPTGTIEFEYPRLYAGPATFVVDTAGTLAGNLICELRDVEENAIIDGFYLPAGTTRAPYSKQTTIPARPVMIRVNISAGALGTNARIAIMQSIT